jgi:hypothetical protein
MLLLDGGKENGTKGWTYCCGSDRNCDNRGSCSLPSIPANSYTNANAYTYAYPYTNAHADSHSNPNAHTYTHSYPDGATRYNRVVDLFCWRNEKYGVL